MTKSKIAVLSIAGLVLIFWIVVGGWHLRWWLREESVNRRTEIANQSVARQASLQAELLDLNRDLARLDVTLATATEAQVGPLRAQRVAIADRFCDAYAKTTDRIELSTNIHNTATQEC